MRDAPSHLAALQHEKEKTTFCDILSSSILFFLHLRTSHPARDEKREAVFVVDVQPVFTPFCFGTRLFLSVSFKKKNAEKKTHRRL